jgi:HEAT repeat protein
VPVLIKMLADSDLWVRSNAAFALAEMTVPAALTGMKTAMTTDYGTYNEASRNPGIWAYVLRSAVAQFPKEPATKEVLAAGAASSDPSVKFMALVAQQ